MTGAAGRERDGIGEPCLIVFPKIRSSRRDSAARLDEAVGLASAIGLDVRHSEAITLSRRRSATLFGSGVIERLGEIIVGDLPRNLEREGAHRDPIKLVVVDGPLAPVQQRNLENRWKTKVIDRTGLILEIFGERARTREGVLQVELASLIYARSRLVRSWTHLERQRGGLGFVGGPGETQIESDRRMISDRIIRLQKDLKDVRRTRSLHRQARRRVPFPVIALVGYTNAGKSTLFNRLTDAQVVAKDQLFATLDPTMRGLVLPSGRKIILSDTVGFISELPHELVAAFRATLEEVKEADLIIHVRDAAHPDTEEQLADVLAVLRDEMEMGEDIEDEIIEVMNKTDLMSEDNVAVLRRRCRYRTGGSTPVSALTGDGCQALLEMIDARLVAGWEEVSVHLDSADGATMAWLHRRGEVVRRHDDETGCNLVVRLKAADKGRLKRMMGGRKSD